MTKMYIGNCTQQEQVVMYRVAETAGLRTQVIGIGRQEQVSGDLTKFDVDAIVEQHSRYGMVSVDEIDRTRPFIGICYSLDKPINVEALKTAIRHNTTVLTERGREMREQYAVAVNNAIEEQVGPLAGGMEFTIIEEEGKASTDGHEMVNETIRVDRSIEGPRETGGKARQNAGRKGRGR